MRDAYRVSAISIRFRFQFLPSPAPVDLDSWEWLPARHWTRWETKKPRRRVHRRNPAPRRGYRRALIQWKRTAAARAPEATAVTARGWNIPGGFGILELIRSAMIIATSASSASAASMWRCINATHMITPALYVLCFLSCICISETWAIKFWIWDFTVSCSSWILLGRIYRTEFINLNLVLNKGK